MNRITPHLSFRLFLWLALLTASAAMTSCRSGPEEPKEAAASKPAAPTAPRVHPDRSELIYRYRDPATGTFQSASSPSEVPPAQGREVVVYDPEHDVAGWFFVADLSQPAPDGSFPTKVVSAAEMTARSVQVAAQERSQAARAPVVRLYSASWCGACRKARAFMEKEKIPFVEKDVEKDPSAQREINAAARKAGKDPASISGVPVIVIGDQIMVGFDPGRVRALSRKGG